MDEMYTQLSVIVIAGLLSCWVARLIHIPEILLMLLAGFFVGPVTGWVDPQQLFGGLLLPIVSISVAIILFEGGLSLRLESHQKFGFTVFLLVLFSVILGIAIGSIFFVYSLNFPPRISVLLSSILVITGPTVILPLLQQLHIKEPVRSLLRWEGILIDPVGAVVSVLVFEALFPVHYYSPVVATLYGIVMSLFVGIGLGLIAAQALLFLLRRYMIPEALHNPVVLLILLSSYFAANLIQTDSGLVTATVMGFVLTNQKDTSIRHIVEFKESLRIILIAFLFVLLAASVDFNAVKEWWQEVAALLFLLLVVVRPLTVWLATFRSGLELREKILMAVVAPRGIVSAAVASLFSLELLKLGFEEGDRLVPIVFSTITGTVVISGIATFVVSRWVGLASTYERGVLIIGANAFAREIGEALAGCGFCPHYIDTHYWKLSEARQLEGNVYYGSFVAFPEENQELLDEIGAVLALTESDDINSLAIHFFSHHFTQEQLFQIRPNKEDVPEYLTGRLLSPKALSLSELRNHVEQGGKIRFTSLSEKFSFDAWREQYPKAEPLFYVPRNAPFVPIDSEESYRGVKSGSVIFLSTPG